MFQLDVNEVVSIDNTNSLERETLIDQEFSLCPSYPQKAGESKSVALEWRLSRRTEAINVSKKEGSQNHLTTVIKFQKEDLRKKGFMICKIQPK